MGEKCYGCVLGKKLIEKVTGRFPTVWTISQRTTTNCDILHLGTVYLNNSSVFKQNHISTALTVRPDSHRHSPLIAPSQSSSVAFGTIFSIIQNITHWNRKVFFLLFFLPDPELPSKLFSSTLIFSFQNCSSCILSYQSGSLNLHFEVRLASEVWRGVGGVLNTGLAKICSRKTLDLTPNTPLPHAQFGLSPGLF